MPTSGSHLKLMPDEDRFIISRINSVAATVDAATKECQLHRATRELVNFILEDLSRWYVQLVRPRMWLEGEIRTEGLRVRDDLLRDAQARDAPRPVLPAPHRGDLREPPVCTNDPASVHLLDWYAGDSSFVNRELEHAVELVRSFDEASANARQAGKRKLRWPVAEVVVVVRARMPVKDAIERLNAVCMDRANARKVRVVMGGGTG